MAPGGIDGSRLGRGRSRDSLSPARASRSVNRDGNLTSDNGVTYTYDARDELGSATATPTPTPPTATWPARAARPSPSTPTASRSPPGPAAVSDNLYAYGDDNPVTVTDPPGTPPRAAQATATSPPATSPRHGAAPQRRRPATTPPRPAPRARGPPDPRPGPPTAPP